MKVYYIYGVRQFPIHEYECVKVVADTPNHANDLFFEKYDSNDIEVIYKYDEKEFKRRFSGTSELAPEIRETLYQYIITEDEELTLRSLLKYRWDAIARDGIGRLFAYNAWNTTRDWRNPEIILFEKRVRVHLNQDSLNFVSSDKGLFKIEDILENSKIVRFDEIKNLGGKYEQSYR